MVTAQFLGKIDHNSLSVQDQYIFVKVNHVLHIFIYDVCTYLLRQILSDFREFSKWSPSILYTHYHNILTSNIQGQ